MLSRSQAEDVVALLASEKSVTEVAHAHGVEVNVVEGWRAGYLAGLRASESRPRFSRGAVLAALVLGALVFGARDAWAQATCSYPGLPSPLRAFCPESPAIAADVNGNFVTMVNWVQAKTGPIADAGVLTPNLRVTGNTTLAGTTVTTLNASGLSTLAGTTTGDLTANHLTVNGNFTRPITFGSAATRTIGPWKEAPGGNAWGNWGGRVYCDAGQFVCGLEQRVEGNQGSNDDTSVNSVAIICCTLGY